MRLGYFLIVIFIISIVICSFNEAEAHAPRILITNWISN